LAYSFSQETVKSFDFLNYDVEFAVHVHLFVEMSLLFDEAGVDAGVV